MITRTTVAFFFGTFLTGGAQATLIDRGGGLIYDNVLNITWLQDANYAATNAFGVAGVGPDGSMDWATASQWINALNAAQYKGFVDWRLPRIAPIGTDFVYYQSYDGSTDYGYNNRSPNSELAFLFYEELDNKGRFDTFGNLQVGHGLVDDPLNHNDESLFINLPCTSLLPYCPTYWSGTRYGQNPYYPTNNDAVWVFDMSLGAQSGDYESKAYRAWAVHDGDIGAKAVPEPETYALILAGLGLIGLMASRGRSK